MSAKHPFNGNFTSFRGSRIERDLNVNRIRTSELSILPQIKSTDPPPGALAGVGGGIAYDIITDRPYYSDGYEWFPIGSGSVSQTVYSYSFIKDGLLNVPASIETVINMWDDSSVSVYHSIPEWNVGTGIFTAMIAGTLTVYCNISWTASITNQGTRYLRVQYKPAAGVWSTVKETIRQASPSKDIESTQECQIHLHLLVGDQVRTAVYQDSSVAITIDGDDRTSLCGFFIPD